MGKHRSSSHRRTPQHSGHKAAPKLGGLSRILRGPGGPWTAAGLTGSLLLGGGLVVAGAASADASFHLRVAAGADKQYTAPSGTVWSRDRGFVGGKVLVAQQAIKGTKADGLYQHVRTGVSEYELGVDCAGSYEVSLHWAETRGAKAGERVMRIRAEGKRELGKIDVAAAVGRNRAMTKTFAVRVDDGKLSINFRSIAGKTMISGIHAKRTTSCVQNAAIGTSRKWPRPRPTTSPTATKAPTATPTPSSPSTSAFTARLNAASSNGYTDPSGVVWSQDKGFVGGSQWQGGSVNVGNTTADPLYRKHRWGMTGYQIPVPSAGTYRVDLHVAELVFRERGRRVFDVKAEGVTKVDDLDVFAVAGADNALVKSFDVAVSDGTLNLGFAASADDPMVSGIAVTRIGSGTAPTTPAPAPTTPAPAPTTPAPAPTTPAPAPTTPAPAPTSPATGQYPNANNTGVPAGTSLRSSGSITVTQNGALLDGLDVSGSIRVEANNVTIKRTRIRNSGGQAITINPSTTGTVIEDVEIDGRGNTDGASAIGDSNFTLRRANIHHVGEGPRANSNVVIEDSYMHDFLDFVAAGAHQDGIQGCGGSNLVFRHNTILMNVDGGNAAIMIGTDYGSNLVIDNNLLAGGGYTVYGGDSNGWTNVRITNNRFSTMFYPKSGYHGALLYAERATKSGNVWHESGQAL